MLTMHRAPARWSLAISACAATVALVALWVSLTLRHPSAPIHGATDTFSYVCNVVAPALPYLSAAIIPSALAVMAPCLLQMSIVLVTALTGGVAGGALNGPAPVLWRQGLSFGAGFLGVYLLAALGIGLVGQALMQYAVVLSAIGGVLILALGLAVLRLLPRQALSGCRGPRWLLMTGKASLRKPFAAGIAFAVYCVTCCGPYLSGLALLGAGTGSALTGATIVLAFAALMGLLLLLPIFALPLSQKFTGWLTRHARLYTTLAGVALLVMGTALTAQPLLVAALR